MAPTNDASRSVELRPDQMTFKHFSEVLAPLESFDPSVFLATNDESADLAAFVLALALAFDDIRNAFIAQVLLNPVEPSNKDERTPRRGFHAGLRAHLVRVIAGYLHEMLALIEKDRKKQRGVIESNDFQELLRKLSPQARESWQLLYDAATGTTDGNELSQFLVQIRNNVAFHFDGKALLRGFKRAFDPERTTLRPLISRGNSPQTTQCYFADAAAQQRMLELVPHEERERFFTLDSPLLLAIHQPLFEIVVAFVQSRRGAWRPES